MRLPSRGLLVVALCFSMIGGAFSSSAVTKQDEAWQIIRANLSEKDTDKRVVAVRVLGLLTGDPVALTMAQKAVDDEKPDVRAAAATTLGQLHSKSSVPRLHTLLLDDEPEVVLAAAHALIEFKDPDGYDVYYEVLTGDRKTGKGLIAQQKKLMKDPTKMAEFGFEQGIGFVPFAGIGFSAFKALRADDVSPVRAAAAKMLIDDPDPTSAKALVAASADKSWIVKTAALEAIAKRGDPKLLDGVLPAMADENTSVRCTAAAAVIRLSTRAGRKASKAPATLSAQ